MSHGSPATLSQRASKNHASSNGAQSVANATQLTEAPPSTVGNTVLRPSGLMLPPPRPSSPPLPSTAAHLTALHSGTAQFPGNTLSPPPAAGTNEPAPVPAPRTLKLQSQISTLQTQISTTQRTLDETLAKLQHHLPTTADTPQASPDETAAQAQAQAIVKRHIKLLQSYNDIRDVGQGLMGLIADSRGIRLREVMEEMGVGEKD